MKSELENYYDRQWMDNATVKLIDDFCIKQDVHVSAFFKPEIVQAYNEARRRRRIRIGKMMQLKLKNGTYGK